MAAKSSLFPSLFPNRGEKRGSIKTHLPTLRRVRAASGPRAASSLSPHLRPLHSPAPSTMLLPLDTCPAHPELQPENGTNFLQISRWLLSKPDIRTQKRLVAAASQPRGRGPSGWAAAPRIQPCLPGRGWGSAEKPLNKSDVRADPSPPGRPPQGPIAGEPPSSVTVPRPQPVPPPPGASVPGS